MEKLTLNDASVTLRKETSVALGPGFRCGFLGMLHMDVFMQRLSDEHDSEVCLGLFVLKYLSSSVPAGDQSGSLLYVCTF
jgi:translation elongation factor EF-4